jgi:hypothetical protein
MANGSKIEVRIAIRKTLIRHINLLTFVARATKFVFPDQLNKPKHFYRKRPLHKLNECYET